MKIFIVTYSFMNNKYLEIIEKKEGGNGPEKLKWKIKDCTMF